MGKPKSRANSEGTVFERPDRPGTFRALFYYTDPEDGKRKRKPFDAKTKKAALKAGRDWLQKLDGGLLPEADKLTLWTWLDRWLEDYMKPKGRTKSYIKAESCLRLYVKPHLGNEMLTKLKSPDIQRVFIQLLSTGGKEKAQIVEGIEVKEKCGISSSTVRMTRRYLIMALDKAIKVGLLLRNVAKETESPRLVKREINPLSREQSIELCKAAWEQVQYVASLDPEKTTASVTVADSSYIAILLALSTGMRLGEIFGLKWDAVDLAQGIIYVKRSLETGQTKEKFHDPKTPKSRRPIPLPDDAAKELREYKDRQDEKQSLLGDKWGEINLVITNDWGKILDTGNFTKRHYKPLLKKIGVDPKQIDFHDLRHTHATLLLLAGIHPKIVSERLGHASISITLDTYSHLLPNTQELAAKAMEGLAIFKSAETPDAPPSIEKVLSHE